jgi:hypothetical protein
VVFAFMLLAAGCGDSPSVEQTADQVVTVTVTKTVGTTDGTPTDDGSTSTEEPSDQGLAGIGDTITLRGYEEGTEVAVTVTHLIDPAGRAVFRSQARSQVCGG